MKKIIVIPFLVISLLCKSQGGAEMINNGNFVNSDDWTINGSHWTITGGTANFLDVSGSGLKQLAGDMVSPVLINTVYILTFQITNCDRSPYSDQARIFVESTDGGIEYVTGAYYREDKTHQLIFKTPANIGDGGISFYGSTTGGTFTIDNISLKTPDAKGAQPYYLDPAGSDYAAGDIVNPWRTLNRAFFEADAGDTVLFRDGVYYLEGCQKHAPEEGIGNDGTEGNRIVFMSYPGEWAIFDGSNLCDWIPANSANDAYNIAIYITYSAYLTFKDFELRNVYQCDHVTDNHVYAFTVLPAYKINFDHVIIHQIGGGGLQVQSGAWKSFYEGGHTAIAPKWDTDIDTLRFLNMDIYELMDSTAATPGSDANPVQLSGYDGNVLIWEGCRFWNYGGDGQQASGGTGCLRIYDRCWFMPSKKYAWGSGYEGNGLKYGWNLGSYNIYEQPTHDMIRITNCIAMFCGDYGFRTAEPTKGYIYNNTVYSASIGFHNGTTYTEAPYNAPYIATMRNNIAYGITDSYGGLPQYPYLSVAYGEPYSESHNVWDYNEASPIHMVVTDTVTVTDADFVTVDSATLVTKFTAARQADGSLPIDAPLQLAVGSDLINAGIGVGLIFDGRGYVFDDDTISIGYLQFAGDVPPDPAEPDPPSVSTNAITLYDVMGATAGVNVTSDGSGTMSARGVCWNTSINPTTANTKIAFTAATGSASAKIYGLTRGTTYHFRGYGTNETGTSYGANVSITTPLRLPARYTGKTLRHLGKTLIIR